MLRACALACTISLWCYRGISLSFHLVTVLFQLVTCYFTFPTLFHLNSDFSHAFFNGKLTRRTIKDMNSLFFFLSMLKIITPTFLVIDRIVIRHYNYYYSHVCEIYLHFSYCIIWHLYKNKNNIYIYIVLMSQSVIWWNISRAG